MNFNLLFIILSIIAVYYIFIEESLDLRIIILAFAFTGFAFVAVYSGSAKLSHYVKILVTITIPLLLTGFRLAKADLEAVLLKFMPIFNILCIILVVIGIYDYFTGASVQLYFAEHQIYDEDMSALVLWEHSTGIYRYYSFIGHPLTNAWYLLVFYTLNIICNKYYKTIINEYLLLFITLLGLLLCGSKTALIAGLVMIIFLNNSKHKLAFVSLASVLCAATFTTALFQRNLMQRFAASTLSADMSGGRNEALSWLIHGYVKPPELLTGGSLYYSYKVTMIMGFIKSFEYPLIMLSYDLGLFATIIIYLTILIIPVYILVNNRNYLILVFFLILFVYINGFSAMANYTDFTGQFCFIVMLLINISYIIHGREEGVMTS